MNHLIFKLFLTLLLSLFYLNGNCFGVESQNLIKNPQFKEGIEGWRSNCKQAKNLGTMSFVKEDGIPGKAMKFECTKDALFFYQPLKSLQVGEKYIFAGYLKADLKSGNNLRVWVLGDSDNKEAYYAVKGKKDWEKFALVFTLKNKYKSLKIGMSGIGKGGVGYLADLKLYKYSDYQKEFGKVSYGWKNILYNGGFEIKNVSDIPDGWSFPIKCLRVSDLFRISRKNPHSGNECVELSTPPEVKTRNGNGALYKYPHSRISSTQCHAFKKDEKIRISLWARSKPAGQKFFITFQWFKKSETFTTTEKWQKYIFEVIAPCNISQKNGCVIIHKVSDINKKLYIDDVAMEIEGVNLDQVKIKKNSPPAKPLTVLKSPSEFSKKLLITNRFYDSRTGKKAENSAKVYAYATPEKLFVKFIMPTKGEILPTEKITDADSESKIFKNDIGEIFLMPENGVYYHFAFDAGGNKFDQKMIGVRPVSDWNGVWKITPKIKDNTWEAVIEIPHTTYSPSKKPPEILRANFNRETPGFVPSSWSPTFGSFHSPSRFGKLKFDNAALLAKKFIGVASISVVKNPSTNSKDVKVNLVGNIPENSIFSLSTEDGIFKAKIEKNGQNALATLSLPYNMTEKEIIDYKVISPENEIVFESTDKDIIQEQELFNAYLNKSYYNYETKAYLNCSINLASEQILKRKFLLDWQLDNGKLKGSSKCETKNTRIGIDLSKVSLGADKLQVQLFDGSGKLCYKQTLNLLKASKDIKARSKIDRERLCLEIDKKPVIIKGVTLPTIRISYLKKSFKDNWRGYVDAICDFIDELPGHGFNMVRLAVWCDGDPDLEPALQKILKTLKKNNIYVFLRFKPDKSQGKKYKFEEFAAVLYKQLKKVKDNDQIMAFITVDEPGLWWFNDLNFKTKFQEKGLQELYDNFRKEIKYRPIYINYANSTMRKMFGGKKATDIYSFDMYVFGRGGHESFRGEPWLECARFLGAASQKDRKPFGNWIQCTAGYEWATFPNERQMLYQGYFSLICGARIIYNFVFHLRPESKDTLSGFKKFSQECDQLEPAILNGETIASVASDKKILILAKRYKDKLYVITLNPCREKVSANLKVSLKGLKASKAKVLFENRDISVINNTLSDVYQPLERHVYIIDLNPFWGRFFDLINIFNL
jgi:carbohydrate binding protein with CBM4/9 domain